MSAIVTLNQAAVFFHPEAQWKIHTKGSVVAWVKPYTLRNWVIHSDTVIPMYRPDRRGD